MTDAIRQLIEDLSKRGKPSLGWLTQWSNEKRDPVHAAWEASKDLDAMWQFAQMRGARLDEVLRPRYAYVRATDRDARERRVVALVIPGETTPSGTVRRVTGAAARARLRAAIAHLPRFNDLIARG